MSIEIILIPLAIAAIGAAKARLDDGPTGLGRSEVRVQSRLRDGNLVASALRDLGAAIGVPGEGTIAADFDSNNVTFARNGDGLWVATFDSAWDEERAFSLVTDLDAAYGLRVQQEVLRKIHERAADAGMSVTSETVDDDKTVTLLLNVGTA